jgi:hypothetical protein
MTLQSMMAASSSAFNARPEGFGRGRSDLQSAGYGHHLRAKEARRDYQGQVDYFGVYCPETVTVYLVPIADLPVRVQAALRVEPARNRQKCKIRLASSYEIGQVSIEAPRRAPQLS